MQHPIGEHALLADSRTAALVDPDGNVAWLCWPWVDATPLLFSILDADRGGTFSLRPALREARVLSRRYHPRSLVLETVWEVGPARLIVDEALDLGEGPLLVRSVRAQGDAVDVTATVSAPAWPGTTASLRIIDHALELDGVSRVVVHAPSRWEARPDGATCEFIVDPGTPQTVTLATVNTKPRIVSIEPALTEWRRRNPESSARNNTSSDTRDLLSTTAAVLVGLRRSNGGIVAAPTSSLPQWPGSARTWDYRYCWLRDSSLAALAMLRLGLTDEARSLGAFLGNVVMNSGPVPLVRLDGSTPPDETEIPDLTGYGGARPVRIGNAAAAQAQLDVPGEVIELATSLARASALPDELASAVPILAGWLVDHWREPDNGIWEVRGEPRRYTHSLVTAVSGLRGAAALADQRSVFGDADAWRQAAAAAAADLGTTGPLELRIDGGGADAALTQVALLGGLEPIAHRVDATLDLIAERLDHGGLVDRYEGQPDMIADPCAPFVFPTFWLAGALAATGRDGSRWLEAALATRGPLGLFGEVADPDKHTPLGNYPQVQSHAAFALAVADPKGSF
jgi:GH15 family glucan-1,4-alpha-glucosidase